MTNNHKDNPVSFLNEYDKDTAIQYNSKINQNLCFIAINQDKSPISGISWKDPKNQYPTNKNLSFAGLVCGEPSGNLFALDIDNHFKDADYLLTQISGKISLDEFPIIATQNGGFHVLFRCSVIGNNQKFARRLNDSGRPETLIESRENNGYIATIPTPGYKFIQGTFDTIPTIRIEDKNELLTICKSLNEYHPEAVKTNTKFENDEKPGDLYNNDLMALEEVKSILRSNGWNSPDDIYWTRPGKKSGVSATFGKVARGWFYVFSSNASPFDAEKAYNPFQVYSLLTCKGDFKQAARNLSERYHLPNSTTQTNSKSIEPKNLIRVGNNFFKLIDTVDKNGNINNGYISISRQTILDDFGKSILKRIKKYNAFCNTPSHLNYKSEIAGNKNLYEPLQHIPATGKWPTIEKFLVHVFGNQYELGLDYLQILYLDPCQKLPVLCLVSVENNTGKTTFGNFLIMIFGANACLIGTSELISNFNASYASKLISVVDESKIAKNFMDRVKMLATADIIHLRRMHTDYEPIGFFGKFILLSNNERDFITANESDTRFWIRKLYPVDYDPNFEKKLKKEIPAFLNFLQGRQLSTKKSSRMHFAPEQLKTNELKAVIEESKSWIVKEIKEGIVTYLNGNNLNECQCTAKDIKDYLFERNFSIGVSDIRAAIRDELNMKPTAKTTRYRFPDSFQGENKVGKPYVFYLKDLE